MDTIDLAHQSAGTGEGTLLTTSEESSSGGMWVMVPQVRVSILDFISISRDSPKSATLAVTPYADVYTRTNTFSAC